MTPSPVDIQRRRARGHGTTRRAVLAGGAFGLLLSGAAVAGTVEVPAPVSTAAFLDMIGVQTHMSYGDTAYADRDRVIAALRSLGVDSVRDRVPNGRGLDATKYLAQRGIRFTVTVRAGQSPKEVLETLYDIRRSVPNAVEAVEGYNEINHGPVSFNGLTGAKGGAAGQAAIYAAVKGDPVFGRLPVYNLTGIDMVKDPEVPWDSLKGYADHANFHVYPQNGRQPGIWINPRMSEGYALKGDFPRVITEFGYFTLPKPNVSGFIGVDERTQAKGVVNGLFDAAAAGVKRVFIYELVDQKPDPAQNQREMHFGLFRNDFSPKPAATALINLRAILGAQGKGGGKPRDAQFTVESEAGDLRTLRLRNAAGDTFIAVWREPQFWDRAKGVPVEVAPVTATLRLGTRADIARFDVFTSRDAVEQARQAGELRFDVRDTVVLVRVR